MLSDVHRCRANKKYNFVVRYQRYRLWGVEESENGDMLAEYKTGSLTLAPSVYISAQKISFTIILKFSGIDLSSQMLGEVQIFLSIYVELAFMSLWFNGAKDLAFIQINFR